MDKHKPTDTSEAEMFVAAQLLNTVPRERATRMQLMKKKKKEKENHGYLPIQFSRVDILSEPRAVVELEHRNPDKRK